MDDIQDKVAASADLAVCDECKLLYCVNCSDATEPDEWCSVECENA